MLITLKGKLRGKVFVNDDGVCIPLKYKFDNEPNEVFIHGAFNEDKTLSVYKIFRIK